MQNEHFQNIVAPMALQIAEMAYNQGFVHGQSVGFERGMAAGQFIGFAAAMNNVKPAISEGTRMRSPECARILQGMRNLTSDFVTDDEYASLFEQDLIEAQP